MSLTLRGSKGSKLTIKEFDDNFSYLDNRIDNIGITTSTSIISLTYSSIISLTYSQFYDDIINGNLIPGVRYKITDYQSVNFINGWSIADAGAWGTTYVNTSIVYDEVYIGATESISFEAISTSEINLVGISYDYPDDIVEYIPYVNKLGCHVDYANGYTDPNGNIFSGIDMQWDGSNVYIPIPASYSFLYGHYLYLYVEYGAEYLDCEIDILKPGINNFTRNYNEATSTRYQIVDNKLVLLDLTNQNYLDYVADSAYIAHIYPMVDAKGWVGRRTNKTNGVSAPFDFRYVTYIRYQLDLTSIDASISSGYWGIGDSTFGVNTGTQSQNSLSLNINDGYYNSNLGIGLGSPDGGSYTSLLNCTNNIFGVFGNFNINANIIANNTFLVSCFNSNIVGQLGNSSAGNLIKGQISNCEFKSTISSVIITDEFKNNNINGNFTGNKIIGKMLFCNIIAESFSNNTLVCDTSPYFSYNNLFGYFSDCVFGYSKYNYIECQFYSNTIGNDFNYNKINTEFFNNNTIGTGFTNNEIRGDIRFSTINNNFRQNEVTTLVSSQNFTSSTHVYGDYYCLLFKGSNGVSQLGYINTTTGWIFSSWLS